MLFSGTRRDDSDDFLAIEHLTVYMNYEQNDCRAWFKLNLAKGMPSLLPGPFVDAIRTDETSPILKHQRSQFE